MKISGKLHGFFWSSMTVNNCNSYLLDGPTPVLIDPGHRQCFDHVRRELAELGLDLGDIGLVICTHAHPDHVEAVTLFRSRNVQVAYHRDEWRLLEEMQSEIQTYFGLDVATVRPDFLLGEGELDVDGCRLQVMHTPGHSPGSICLYWEEEKTLFTGDLVFRDGLGRTDLPGGDSVQLKESIRRVAGVDCERVLPGHGEMITGRAAVRHNFDQLEQVWFNYI